MFSAQGAELVDIPDEEHLPRRMPAAAKARLAGDWVEGGVERRSGKVRPGPKHPGEPVVPPAVACHRSGSFTSREVSNSWRRGPIPTGRPGFVPSSWWGFVEDHPGFFLGVVWRVDAKRPDPHPQSPHLAHLPFLDLLLLILGLWEEIGRWFMFVLKGARKKTALW